MLHISRHCHPSGSWILLHNKHQPVVVYAHAHANDTQALSYRDYRGRPAQHTQTCRCAQKKQQQNPGLAVVRGWQGPGHNLPLIIYTAWLTVLMQRPEKIQATNRICTQRAEESRGEGEARHQHNAWLSFLLTFERNNFCKHSEKEKKIHRDR